VPPPSRPVLADPECAGHALVADVAVIGLEAGRHLVFAGFLRREPVSEFGVFEADVLYEMFVVAMEDKMYPSSGLSGITDPVTLVPLPLSTRSLERLIGTLTSTGTASLVKSCAPWMKRALYYVFLWGLTPARLNSPPAVPSVTSIRASIAAAMRMLRSFTAPSEYPCIDFLYFRACSRSATGGETLSSPVHCYFSRKLIGAP
jgi:hypothetical protein